MTDESTSNARLVGINHVAIEVGDVEAALEFYEALFRFDLRGRSASKAFLDAGDQFFVLAEGSESVTHNGSPAGDGSADGDRSADGDKSPDSDRSVGDDSAEGDVPTPRDDDRHVGLVVDDPDAVERRLASLDVDSLSTPGLDFHDPWGNRIQVVAYEEIQFTKADHVLRGMGLGDLEKSPAALDELAEKGLAPDDEAPE